MKKRIVLAIGGSSGSIYAKVLIDKLLTLNTQLDAVGIVMSDNARFNWEYELDTPFNADGLPAHFKFYTKMDFMAPFASGSARYDTMIVCPCSMGLMARIATGISNDLVTRAADVILKERRKLILVPRETPLSILHINNMKTITEAGGIICPATPNFYSKPKTVEDVAATVIDRVLDLAGFDFETYRWSM
jgi:flavin prenyltransferase